MIILKFTIKVDKKDYTFGMYRLLRVKTSLVLLECFWEQTNFVKLDITKRDYEHNIESNDAMVLIHMLLIL